MRTVERAGEGHNTAVENPQQKSAGAQPRPRLSGNPPVGFDPPTLHEIFWLPQVNTPACTHTHTQLTNRPHSQAWGDDAIGRDTTPQTGLER